MKWILALIFGFLLGGMLSEGARGEGSGDHPVTAATTETSLTGGLVAGSRIIKTFDFEEEKLGNFETVPMYWNKVAGRGYPLYTGGHFDKTVYRSASHSFELDLDGGSVAYRLGAGKLPVNPNADYFILGFVKTTGLKYARAEIAAWFADGEGKLLPGTESHSQRWASATGNDDWHVLQIYMPGLNPAARSLVLQVGVLQPQQLSEEKLGRFELYQQDIKGKGWFDDLVVFQLPRVSLGVGAVGGIVGPGEKAELTVTVSDLGREELTAGLEVVDGAGKVVRQEKWGIGVLGLEAWTKRVELKGLGAGAYTGTLEVADPRSVIVRRQVKFAVTGDYGAGVGAAGEFGVNAAAWPVEAWGELPAMVERIGAGLVKLPAWRKEMTEEELTQRDPALEGLIGALGRLDIKTMAAFGEVPTVLAGRLDEKRRGGGMVGLLEEEVGVWRPYVSFTLARYASGVGLWEIGGERDMFGADDPRYAKVYGKTVEELSGLLGGAKLVVPWNALYDFDAQRFGHAVLDLRIPTVIKPEQIPAYLAHFKQGDTEVLAAVEPLEEGKYGRVERLNDFARRVVMARSVHPRAVMVDLPVGRRVTLMERSSEPGELVVVYRTLAKVLGGALFKQEVELAGVRAVLFDRRGTGVLVLWNEKAKDAEVKVRVGVDAGRAAQAVDLWGRTAALGVDEKNGEAEVGVTATPRVVEGVDWRLVALKGSFGLGTKVLPAGTGVAETVVRLSNPYDGALQGTLRLVVPPGWTCEPSTVEVDMVAGGKLEKKVTLRYPFGEFAGAKVIKGTLKTAVGGLMDMAAYVEVSSAVVSIECLGTLLENGDLVLQQMVTNTSGAVVNGQAYAMVPGMPRQQRYVVDLKPGETVVKRFVFPHAGGVVGKTAAVGLKDMEGKVVVAKGVVVE